MWRLVWLGVAVTACERRSGADRIQPEAGRFDTGGPTTPGSPTAAPSRSGVMALSDARRTAYVADAEAGDVLRVDAGVVAASPVTLQVGGEPTRLVVVGDDVFVTLRAAGEVVRLREDGDGLTEQARAWVGAEPFDVVASPTEPRIYVSLSQEDAVVALDADTLAPVGRWDVPGEPRWMAIRSDDAGVRVEVASFRGGRISELDPASGEVVPRWLPAVPRSDDPACGDLAARITGEILVDGAGSLYVPALYADTRLGSAPPGCSAPPAGGDGWYASPVDPDAAADRGRFNPAVVQLDLRGGPPTVWAIGARVDTPDRRRFAARGAPTSLDLDRARVHVTLEGSDALVTATLDPALAGTAGLTRAADRRAEIVDQGPVAVRRAPWQPGVVWTWSWLARTVQGRIPGDLDDTFGYPWSLPAAPSTLDPDVLAGRAWFYADDDPAITTVGSGVSCATCHVDGRDDGLTWSFGDAPRATPTLAGGLAATAPMTWTGEVPSVAAQVGREVTDGLGGEGLPPDAVRQIAAFIESIRLPEPPRPSAEEEARIAAGREVFGRPAVGCAGCHDGPAGTRNAIVPIFGLPAVNVPPLRGVAATAPYLHDGSAPTLRAVLERARDGSMGDTSSLDEAEMDALEAFVRFYR